MRDGFLILLAPELDDRHRGRDRSIIASGRDPNLRAAARKLRDRITRSRQ